MAGKAQAVDRSSMSAWREQLDRALDDESERMSAWEVEFIESLEKQSEIDEWVPSGKQLEILERIDGKLP